MSKFIIGDKVDKATGEHESGAPRLAVIMAPYVG